MSLESWQVAEGEEDSRSMSLEQTNFFVSGLSLFVLIVCDFDFGDQLWFDNGPRRYPNCRQQQHIVPIN